MATRRGSVRFGARRGFGRSLGDMDEDLGICQQVRKLREGSLPYWRPLWAAREQERAFLDGDRYEESNNLYNKDRRRQQFRGQETSNVNRHKAAQATAAPRSLEALPVDQRSDPFDAEIAVGLLNWEIKHPQKGFANVEREVVQDAIDMRAGAAMLDFNPDRGSWGECYARWKDANLIMFEPGFSDPHHMECGWMQEARRMSVDDVKAMSKLKGKAKWRVPPDLRPDGEYFNKQQGATNPDGSARLDAFGSAELAGIPGVEADNEHVWVLLCWYKNDRTTYLRQQDEQEIPEGARYMACDNPDCEYRGQTQDELVTASDLEEGETLPETDPMPCPLCGGMVSRRDQNAPTDEVLAYPKGRRLVIQPLLQQTPDDEPFYDGSWPVPRARSFPLLWVTAYVRGGRPMGDSDTTRNWDAQVASDQLMTMAFDRVMRHQTYYMMPQTGLYDFRNQRFEFRDDQFNVIFQDSSDPAIPLPVVGTVEGSSLDVAWPAYWQAVQQVLLAHQGITDFGITPESSKAIPVGTIQGIERQGEIPVAEFIRRKNDALSAFLGVYWDYIRGTYPAARLARMQIGSEYIVAKLRGDELPNMDFLVAEAPEFSGLEKARAEAFQALIQIAQTEPDLVEAFAKFNRFPPSVVMEVQRIMSARAEKAAQAQAQGAPPMDDGSGLAGTDPAMENPFTALQSMRGQAAGPSPPGLEPESALAAA